MATLTLSNINMELNVSIDLPQFNFGVTPPTLNFDLGGVGVPGPPGDSGSEEDVIAGQNLVAGRVVIIQAGKAVYFQPSNAAHAGRAYGVTKTSVNADATVRVVLSGQMQHDIFSFTPDQRLFVAADGVITAAVPSSGISQFVGASLASDTIKIALSHIIKRL